MDEQMYGSIHTHFESEKDAVNAKYNKKGKISFEGALEEFHKLGAKKIAVTEHGAFSSFEDVYNASKNFDDLDVIPGVEVYFDYKGENNPEDRSHLILIAKDRDGYKSLCKIISESNHNIQDGKMKDYPIVTFDNLKKNLIKGSVICTSACISGPICKSLRSDYHFLLQKKEKYEETLRQKGYFEIIKDIEAFKQLDADIKKDLPTKEQEKLAKELKDVEARTRFNELKAIAKERMKSDDYLTLKAKAEAGDKYIKANRLTKTINLYDKQLESLKELKQKMNSKEHITTALDTYKELYELFGEDFYFEIQNHHLPMEDDIYNTLVRFAISVKNPNFIASNDIHICMRKDNPNFESVVQRRKVAKFLGLKKYQEDTIDEYEYGIKTDDELREELLSIIKPYKDFTSEQIVDIAISNIKGALDKCKPYEPIYEDHYPSFCKDDKEEFIRLVNEGIKEKFPDGFPSGKEQEYEERLAKEIDVITSMGYASYHLIVQDYLRYGRLLGYLPEDEIDNAPLDIEELDKLITDRGYERLGYSIGPGRGCFEPDCVVSLKNGYTKPIKDVEIGEYVINDDGYSNRVINKFVYDIQEEMTQIHIAGKNIKCTNDHRILTLVTSKCERPSYKYSYCTKKCQHKTCEYRKKQELKWVEAKDIKRGDYLVYPKPKLPKKTIDTIDLADYGNTDGINRIIKVDKNLAEFIGLYLGNGWIVADDKYKKYAVGNAFNKQSIDKIERYEMLVKQIFGDGLHVSRLKHKTQNVIQIMFYNKTIVEFIDAICSHLAINKHIPDMFMTDDKECIKALIIGMMHTDGCFKDSYKITYSSINLGMVSQLKMLFAHLGYFGTITERIHKKHNWHNEYKLQLSGKQLIDLKEDFLPEIQIKDKAYTRNMFLSDKDNFYFSVGDVSHYNYKGKVYDLCVENNHTYMINNAVVHNSAAGSLACYALGITDIDPIKYELLFEREIRCVH